MNEIKPAGDGPQQPQLKPLYAQIKEILIQRVVSGEWGPGQMLPSEMRLAAEYGVHQGTIRKALDEMGSQNLVFRQQGKGTFVAASSMRHSQYRFLRFAPKDEPGEKPSTELLECSREAATSAERLRLQMDAGWAEVIRLLRTRHYRDAPVIVERISLPADMFSGLEKLIAEQQPDTVYGLLEQKYRVLIVRVVERLTAVGASPEDAKLLGVEEGHPLLEIDRIALAIDGRPVEWRVSRCRTEDHEYTIELT